MLWRSVEAILIDSHNRGFHGKLMIITKKIAYNLVHCKGLMDTEMFTQWWFGNECKSARKKHYLDKKMHNRYRTFENKEKLISASKMYKKTMNKHINNFMNQKHNKLRNMAKHKPKEYWKFLNSLKRKPDPESPDIQEFYDHFKSIYGDILIG